MKRNAHLVLWVIFAALLMAPKWTSATDKINFSGKYLAEQGKNTSETVSTLEVVQSDDSTRAQVACRANAKRSLSRNT